MSTRYRFNHQDFILRDEKVGGLLFDKRTNAFYNLNRIAADILLWIESNISSASILSRLCQLYDFPDRNTLLSDFREFEAYLLEAGVISRHCDADDAQNYAILPQDRYRPIRMEEVDFISRNLPAKRARIVDLGCGAGIYIRHFERDHQVLGLDISKETLWSEGTAPFIVADILNLPLADSSIDVLVLTGHVFGYLSSNHRANASREITRVLRSSGGLFVGVWVESSIVSRAQDLVLVKDPENLERRLHFFTESECEILFNEYAILDCLFLSRDGDFGQEYILYYCELKPEYKSLATVSGI